MDELLSQSWDDDLYCEAAAQAQVRQSSAGSAAPCGQPATLRGPWGGPETAAQSEACPRWGWTPSIREQAQGAGLPDAVPQPHCPPAHRSQQFSATEARPAAEPLEQHCAFTAAVAALGEQQQQQQQQQHGQALAQQSACQAGQAALVQAGCPGGHGMGILGREAAGGDGEEECSEPRPSRNGGQPGASSGGSGLHQEAGAAGGPQVDTSAGEHGSAAVAAAGDGGEGEKRGVKREKGRQLFDYLVVYDLEATCDEAKKLHPQEIIELSCVVVDTCTLRLEGRFQQYCRPTEHPHLTDFCTQLTGIRQDMVDEGIGLEAALAKHTAWLREQGLLGAGKSFVPVTWNDWDMKIQMESECKWRKLQKPKYLARWVDLKAVFIKHYNKRCNLRGSVEHAGLIWEGRAHSAIDDAVNTARLAVKLMQRGLVLGITGSFSGVDASGKLKQSTLFQGRAGPAKKAKVFDEAGKWNGQCSCGVKAKKRMVKRPGPTNGKEFWSCGRFTVTGGAQCDFFLWADSAKR